MRSPMVESMRNITNKSAYSDLQVMKSNAGFYIGTTYEGMYGPEPGSRDSGYYPTHEAAAADLAKLEANPDAIPLRVHP